MTNERDLTLLTGEMHRRVGAAVKAARLAGVDILVYCAARGPWAQARLYRRSRSTAVVHARAAKMRNAGAPWLAGVLLEVGPQATGPWATNAPPGLSWHQWGEAVDAAPVIDGRIPWTDPDAFVPWRKAAQLMGLHAPIPHDWPHVQLRPEGSPLSAGMTWAEIDVAMQERWG